MNRHHREQERLIFDYSLPEQWLQATRSYPMSPQNSTGSSWGSMSSSGLSTSPIQRGGYDPRHASNNQARQYNSGFGLGDDLCVSPTVLHAPTYREARHYHDDPNNTRRVLPSSDSRHIYSFDLEFAEGGSHRSSGSGRHEDRSPSTEKDSKRVACSQPGCNATFSRKADVTRHNQSTHDIKLMDCDVFRCSRVGENGFARNDHLIEHKRGYHGQEIPKKHTKSGKNRHER